MRYSQNEGDNFRPEYRVYDESDAWLNIYVTIILSLDSWICLINIFGYRCTDACVFTSNLECPKLCESYRAVQIYTVYTRV